MDVPQRKSCYTYAEDSFLEWLNHKLDKSEWSRYAGYLQLSGLRYESANTKFAKKIRHAQCMPYINSF